MGKIRIKRDLKNLEQVEEALQELDPLIRVSANKLLGDLLTEYQKARSLFKKANEPLTKNYETEKEDHVGRNKRDLVGFNRKNKDGSKTKRKTAPGSLLQSFRVEKDGTAKYSVGPRGDDQQKKMEGNLKADPNLMRIGPSYRKEIVKFINDRIKKGNK